MSDYQKIADTLPNKPTDIYGTNTAPKLLNITSGERTKESLHFNLQIGEFHYTYHVMHGSTAADKITLWCERGTHRTPAEKRCPHRVRLAILNPALILTTTSWKREKGRKPKEVPRHKLILTADGVRDPDNYAVLEVCPDSPFEEVQGHNHPGNDNIRPLQDLFKENATLRSFDHKREQYDAEMANLPGHWVDQFKEDVAGGTEKTKRSIREKLARRWTSPASEIPEEAKSIPVYHHDPNVSFYHPDSASVVNERFLQAQFTNSKGRPITLWILKSEIHLLDDRHPLNKSPCFIDGTFDVNSKMPGVYQQYSIVRYYSSDNGRKGMSYPLLFCWLPDKTQSTYRAMFKKIRELYFEETGQELLINDWRVDYEPTPKKIIKELWPDAQVCGCEFHYCQCVIKNWRLKLGRKDFVFDVKLRVDFYDVYLGMPFCDPMIVNQALHILETQRIPAIECEEKRKRIEDFHYKYFKKEWITKRHSKADWNLHQLLLKNSYKSPPASVRAFSLLLKDYKGYFLGKFAVNRHARRKVESIVRCERVFYHHSKIESQTTEWKLDNAISICQQFRNLDKKIITYPLSYTVL
ncbi:Oidioi.mRNA.OKI2018_I69.XSR.g14035.t1.cds [Oikopleura dioica]|uniref:Oidioi.mRNA.OKI2018_I69.XSR.g14035.t1.cds n=1 Tax=Oikopleura dioica TaxID=34765 RepID=A0ABN7SCN3_OIKDI|nr:Oidioi.mRNA.OKI2018_I69.XSR.g14035.t1.cds [Oikopleura dioica]